MRYKGAIAKRDAKKILEGSRDLGATKERLRLYEEAHGINRRFGFTRTTLLHQAARRDDSKLVQLLQDHGASPWAEDIMRRTPLKLTARHTGSKTPIRIARHARRFIIDDDE